MDTLFFATTKDNLKSDVIQLILTKKQINSNRLYQLIEEIKQIEIEMDKEQTFEGITFLAMDMDSPQWIGEVIVQGA